VSEVVPHSELLDRARSLAGRIAANPPWRVSHETRFATHRVWRSARDRAWAIEAIRTLGANRDHREGVASFLEKRRPLFEGR